MKPSTTLTLGDFTFSGTEIPERIQFGGDQAMAVHRMVGGIKQVDALGPDHAPLEWSGVLFGAEALSRARYLDWLRVQGKPLALAWSELRYTVVVRSFRATYLLANNIPYTITCEVVSDDGKPVLAAIDTDQDAWIREVSYFIDNISTQVGDAELMKHATDLNAAIRAISDFAKASQEAINSVLLPLQDFQNQIQQLTSSVSNTISSTKSGITAIRKMPGEIAASLGLVHKASIQAPLLQQAQDAAGRIAANIGQAKAGAQLATVGGNLYQIAADAYGDPAEWTTIAAANGLTDPVLIGVHMLTIPAQPDGLGGVPRA